MTSPAPTFDNGYSYTPPPEKTKFSPNFFRREGDGSVKLRIKLSAEEAALIEEAAAETPLMLYIHRVLAERAKFHIEKNNRMSN